MKGKEPLLTVVEVQTGKQQWESVYKFLRKLRIELPFDRASLLWGVYPKDSVFSYRDTYSSVCLGTLFTIAEKWNQSPAHQLDAWIMNMCYLYTMEFCPTAKKNEI